MRSIFLALPFVLTMSLIVYAEGTFSVFAIWNCLPVVLALGALRVGIRRQGAALVAAIAFSTVATLLPGFFHLAWLFDWGGTATGSSTSALAFIFVPFFSGMFATAAGIVAWGVARCFLGPGVSKPN